MINNNIFFFILLKWKIVIALLDLHVISVRFKKMLYMFYFYVFDEKNNYLLKFLAHGVKELRQSLEAASISKEEGDKAKQNPSYKTSLCKNYMMGMYCQFADKCQYAHGRHELRDKPPAVPPSQLPDDVKKRLAEKAKSLPGYKTKICNNFEKEGHCQYDDMCHYAHGEDELKEESEGDKMMAEKLKIRKNPFYKTIMCKSLATCQFGENCVYAHSEDEIRPVASNMMQGASFASKGVGNSSVGGGSMQGSNVMSGGYKTSLCKNYMDSGICSFGTKCMYLYTYYAYKRDYFQPEIYD